MTGEHPNTREALSTDPVSRWKLIPERISELQDRVDRLLSTLNVYECIAMRDMLSEALSTHEEQITHRDEVMNPPASAAQGAEARNLNTSQRHGTGAVPKGGEAQATQHSAAPISMLLWCPECGDRHLDVGEFATKVHHTHACQSCGMVWRPAICPTFGVQWLPGFKNER